MGILQTALQLFKEKRILNTPVQTRGGWFPIVREPFSGAWQQNVEVDEQLVLSFHAVFACISLIASDIAKLRLLLRTRDTNGIWVETENPAYSPVLKKPNHFQNRIQFWENWMLSKLTNGNTYVLKMRDARTVVQRLFILDPMMVKPLISSEGGEIFYELMPDNLPDIGARIIVPAREMIHDRMNCLFHPLVGISPIFAAGLAGTQGLNIQNNSTVFFGNRSMPGGILVAPGRIDPAHATQIKNYWDENFTGTNIGKIAVVGDGLKFERLGVSAEDSQLIEQLKWTAEVVCSAFRVPPYMVGVGTVPGNSNVEALQQQYYSQCLQSYVEAAELCMDEGLDLGTGIRTKFDTDEFFRMDSATRFKTYGDAIGAGIMAPNEARKKFDLPPVSGGESVYLQQQNFSTAALAKRDALEDPFGKAEPAAAAPEPEPQPEPAKALDFDALLQEGAMNHASI